jgi:hypothetical protein
MASLVHVTTFPDYLQPEKSKSLVTHMPLMLQEHVT